MKVAISGAGAFGTALAISLAQDLESVLLLARSESSAKKISESRINDRLPGCVLPDNIIVSADQSKIVDYNIVLLAIPAQKLASYLEKNANLLSEKFLLACCKGIDLVALQGPTANIERFIPSAKAAVLTGPSFANDIALGLPTALSLATVEDEVGIFLQNALTTKNIRLYRTNDTIGAELGGALKNVIAIGAGVAIGSGFGESARAALMTRGFAEMQRLSLALGANATTLTGLSGFGDLALTCTSELSRNYCHGLAIGRGLETDTTATVEGASTALAVRKLATKHALDLPVCDVVAALCRQETNPRDALASLLSRPLKEE